MVRAVGAGGRCDAGDGRAGGSPWARVRAGCARGLLGQRAPAEAVLRMVRRGRRPRQVEEVAPAQEGACAARPTAAMGAAAGMLGGGGDPRPCAEGAVDPRSAAAAAAWRTGRRASGVRNKAKALS
jgi:hypothetical protein